MSTASTAPSTTPTKRSAPPGFDVIREGQADVLIPRGHTVFYNKIQEFNRDTSIAVLNCYVQLRKDEAEEKIQAYLARQAAAKAKEASGEVEARGKRRRDMTSSSDVSTGATSSTTEGVAPDANAATVSENKATEAGNSSSSAATAVSNAEPFIPDRLKFDGLRIFEALSASGLRSIRYFKEIPNIASIHVNDLDPAAVAAIKRNIQFNELPLDKVVPTLGDATLALYMNRVTAVDIPTSHPPPAKDSAKARGGEVDAAAAAATSPSTVAEETKDVMTFAPPPSLVVRHWNVIDLDPYGSAAPFIDGAVQAVENGGILCVTCTDMGVLCGNYAETCFAKYGGMPMNKNPYCHEMALRILLNTIETSCARYQRYIVPLVSLSIDFYCRVFVRVYSGAQKAKMTAAKRGLVFYCTGCRSARIQRLGKNNVSELPPDAPLSQHKYAAASGPSADRYCAECGSTGKLLGPMWMDPIHDPVFAQSVATHVKKNRDKFGTADRIIGMLTTAASELPNAPLYIIPSSMSNVLHCGSPKSLVLYSALHNAGYHVSDTHCAPGAIKTDAPVSLVWDIMRRYVQSLPADQIPWTAKQAVELAKEVGFTTSTTGAASSSTSTSSAMKQDTTGSTNSSTAASSLDAAPAAAKDASSDDTKDKDEGESESPVEPQSSAAIAALSKVVLLRSRGLSPGIVILAKPISNEVDMTMRTMNEINLRKTKMFFPNPEPFWGPKTRAGAVVDDETDPLFRAAHAGVDASVTDPKEAAAALSRAIAQAQYEKSQANQNARKRKQQAEQNDVK